MGSRSALAIDAATFLVSALVIRLGLRRRPAAQLASAQARATWLGPLAGVCTAYQVQVAAEFAAAIPANIRGQGMSGAAGGLLTVQGIGMLASGALVSAFAPSTTVAIAGTAATALGASLAAERRRYATGMT